MQQESDNEVQNFILKMYNKSFQMAFHPDYNVQDYRRQILKLIKLANIKYGQIKKIVHQSKDDWIADLIQIVSDIRAVYAQFDLYSKRFKERAHMHFNGVHLNNFQYQHQKSKTLKKVIQMYKNSNQTQNNHINTNIPNQLLYNTVFFIGLTKGNGVIINNQTIATCAHVLISQNNRKYRFKPFITGDKRYGIVKIQSNGVFQEFDVGFGKIIQLNGQIPKNIDILNSPLPFKFGTQFKPTSCIQIGLLFDSKSQNQPILAFQTAEGFIQRNQYTNISDCQLINQMGLLIHDCYGLWGTSGSPLWSKQGRLIGIHNSWNQDGYNICMIVHDDQTSKCRVIKQYQRRAVSVHVIKLLYEKWNKN